MNERNPIMLLTVSWGTGLMTITWNQALGLVCCVFSIVASYYAIRVSRARLRKLIQKDDENE